MKKILLTLWVLMGAVSYVWAVPANRAPFQYKQPDGTVITLRVHGDEYLHWYTDESGQVVEKNADGFFRPAPDFNLSARAREAHQNRDVNYVRWSSYDNPFSTNFGDRKVLCIIANFTDSTFVVENPNEHFTNMLNQSGYSEGGSIGSVRDYYLDNSWNGTESVYRPQFDVYGPVDLSESSKYYDDNGVKYAIIEAYELLQDQISIEDYDTDNDGAIDMVLFYYPGHNQAEGAGEESIWPHQSSGNFGYFGSKKFNRYFCTSELQGEQGAKPASIGTTCHEFAHSLGLPDFYDTDYEENGLNRLTTGDYDLMCGGPYNDEGRRPPYLSVMERNMLGWMPAPEKITSDGDYTLEPVQYNKGYRLDSPTPGEYFYLEYRNGEKWDSTLPVTSGLLIYRIDQSDRIISGYSTAAYLWENTNKINVYGGRPCYTLVPQIENYNNIGQCVYPGPDNVTSIVPKDFDGFGCASVSNIGVDGSQAAFAITFPSLRKVVGHVFDAFGSPLEGVRVSLTPSTVPFAAAPMLSGGSIMTSTDASGSYTLELQDELSSYEILTFSKDGYVTCSRNLSLSTIVTKMDMTLLRRGQGLPAVLQKYNPNLNMYMINANNSSEAVGMHYSAEELLDAGVVGGEIQSIHFTMLANSGESAYVLVDIPGVTSFRRDITAQYMANYELSIDVSDEHIVIPAGKDMYIGVGFLNIPDAEGYWPFYVFGLAEEDHDGCYFCDDFLNSTDWHKANFGTDIYLDALVSADVMRVTEVDFATLGVSYIKVVEDVPTVVVAAGKSLRSTTWYLDGAAQGDSAPAISTLEAGMVHQYKVQLIYYDGSSETVYYDVEVH